MTYAAVLMLNCGFRTAIRDMVVRGAPAIALTAALALAVEVDNLKPHSGCAEEALTVLRNQLEYLVSRSVRSALRLWVHASLDGMVWSDY